MTTPTKEQSDAAKAWRRGEASPEQWRILRNYSPCSPWDNGAAILHAALEAAEARVNDLEADKAKTHTYVKAVWEASLGGTLKTGANWDTIYTRLGALMLYLNPEGALGRGGEKDPYTFITEWDLKALESQAKVGREDGARLEWLVEHSECAVFKIATSFSSPWQYYVVTYDQSGNTLRQTPHFSTAREAIDNARKEAAP